MQSQPQLAATEDPAPFIKAVGGKTALLPKLHKYLPKNWNVYHEPFIGGGALFWSLCLTQGGAILSDANPYLIRTYIAIRDDVEAVIAHLDTMRKYHGKTYYYEVRKRFRLELPDVAIAASFIYLNKTCFNGLHRVNRDGRFNVPFGSYKNPAILNEGRLRACSAALQGVEIYRGDFLLSSPQERDFWYADPPYIPISATSNFTSYTSSGFGFEEQVKLRDLALRLKRRGVHVLLSNSTAARPLYEKDFEIVEVFRRGTISSKGSGRQPVAELIIR